VISNPAFVWDVPLPEFTATLLKIARELFGDSAPGMRTDTKRNICGSALKRLRTSKQYS